MTAAILSLCQEINPNSSVIEVPVRPEKGAIISECFNNVASKVMRDGGQIVYGWNLWEWERIFIEAEHHAVWEKNSIYIDITPKTNGERKILFLPDPHKIYDFEGKSRLRNIKRDLGKIPSAELWIAATDSFQREYEKRSTNGQATFSQLEVKSIHDTISRAKAQVIVDLASTAKPHDRCICASGKEYRKCCSKLISF